MSSKKATPKVHVHSDHGKSHSNHGKTHSDHGKSPTNYSDHGKKHSDHGKSHSDHGKSHSDHGKTHSDHGKTLSVKETVHQDKDKVHSDSEKNHSETDAIHSKKGKVHSAKAKGHHEKGRTKKGHRKTSKTLGPPPTKYSASNAYERCGAGRRRSSVMIEYFKDNYMGVESGEITETHLKDIRDTFELLDQDKDGRLTIEELSKLLRYTGSLKSDRELSELLEPIDTDHNGSIDFEEFKKYILMDENFLKSLADEVCYEMMDAFKIFDKDGDGFISREELKAVLTQVGDKMPEEDADEFLRAADLNGDGKIDYDEFCKHMGY